MVILYIYNALVVFFYIKKENISTDFTPVILKLKYQPKW